MKNYEYPNWLVSLEIAKELKEIGFDEHCMFVIDYTQYIEPFLVQHRNEGYNAVFYDEVRKLKYETIDKDLLDKIAIIPTWEQVFEWFRSKGYHGVIAVRYEDGDDEYSYRIEFLDELITDFNQDNPLTYEEAREALVKALIRTYKNEQL